MPYVAHDDEDEGDIFTGTRVCRTCKVRQPIDSFYWINNRKNRTRTCKSCRCIQAKVRTSSPDGADRRKKANRSSRIRKYGLTLADEQNMLEAQRYLCAICFIPLDVMNVAIDHNHTTGKVRGILCKNCNWGIGQFRENTLTMQLAILYLKEHRTKVDLNDIGELELGTI